MKLAVWSRFSTLAIFVIAFLAQHFAFAVEPPRVRIGSKASIENIVLGELLTHLARSAGANAEHRSALGGTQIAYQALLKGEIDLYTEYTGTLEKEIFESERIRTPEQLRGALAKRGLAMSESLGFNNPYAIGMSDKRASELNISKISDLARPEHASLRLAFSEEFVHRPDGWGGLKAEYNLPQTPKTMDHNLAYHGVVAGSIDVTDFYATDAEIKYYNLRTLEDDHGYFPSYQCVLLYRQSLAEEAPEILAALKSLEGAIDNAAMMEMNARAKIDHVSAGKVAADFATNKLGIKVKLPRASNMLLIDRKSGV